MTSILVIMPEAGTVSLLNLPQQRITRSVIQARPHIVSIEIPDVDCVNVVETVLQCKVRSGTPGEPDAVRTGFGWTHQT